MSDLTGKRFGRLLVLERMPDRVTESGYHTLMWKCECDCGNICVVRGKCLRNGSTKSCGCLAREELSHRASKHHGFGSRLYSIWNSMRQRCNNPNNHAYHNYGGRGITICSEWDDFNVFRDWALKNGYNTDAPRGICTLERKNVDENYSPENCEWTTMQKQSNNKRNTIYITISGETLSLSDWSRKTGIRYCTLWRRYKSGWEPEKILSK